MSQTHSNAASAALPRIKISKADWSRLPGWFKCQIDVPMVLAKHEGQSRFLPVQFV
jgi:hypothetical protein